MARRKSRRSLPSFKILLAGALAAGVWVVYEDTGAKPPVRPPAPQRSAAVAPRPERIEKTLRVEKLGRVEQPASALVAIVRPPAPVDGSFLPRKTALPPAKPKAGPAAKTRAVTRRETITTARVNLRIRPDTGAKVVMMLEPRRTVWEIAQSGAWRLVSVDGTAGWMHGSYLDAGLRPKIDVGTSAETVASVKKP